MGRANSRAASIVLAVSLSAFGGMAAAQATTAMKTATGLQVRTAAGVLSVEPWTDRIVHVRFARSAAWVNPYDSWVVGSPARTPGRARRPQTPGS